MSRSRATRWAGVALLGMLLAGCSASAHILEASTQGDERTLNLIVGTCNADRGAHVKPQVRGTNGRDLVSPI
jgi:hypothetical protein